MRPAGEDVRSDSYWNDEGGPGYGLPSIERAKNIALRFAATDSTVLAPSPRELGIALLIMIEELERLQPQESAEDE